MPLAIFGNPVSLLCGLVCCFACPILILAPILVPFLILVFSVIGALVFCQTGSDYLNPEKVAERKEKARLHRMKQRLMKEERERKELIFWTNAPIGGEGTKMKTEGGSKGRGQLSLRGVNTS